MKTKLIALMATLSCLLLITLQLHNLKHFSIVDGFDAAGHIEYINFLKTNLRLPFANEGWELYQPPLYYLILAGFSHQNTWQLIGFMSWLSLGLVGFWAMGNFEVAYDKRLLVASLCCSVPVGIYLAPTVSNELFAAEVISTAMVAYLKLETHNTGWKGIVLVGILLGLALLSKATAWVLVGTLLLSSFYFEQLKLPKSLAEFMMNKTTLIVGLSILIGGWFYARNWYVLGNPLATSVDFPQYQISQEPGYRDLAFWFRLRGFWQLDLFGSHWDSIIPGTYYSWFYDGHNVIVPVQEYSLAGILLAIAGVPLLLLGFFGWWLGFKDPKTRLLSLYTLLLLLSYSFYNIKLPFYSTVKGAFLASLIVPFGLLTYLGLKKLHKRWFSWFAGYLLLYVLLILKNFWILPHW